MMRCDDVNTSFPNTSRATGVSRSALFIVVNCLQHTMNQHEHQEHHLHRQHGLMHRLLFTSGGSMSSHLRHHP
eukprot:scaffold10468_cov124-Alexandrium_tamarense.AAC.1